MCVICVCALVFRNQRRVLGGFSIAANSAFLRQSLTEPGFRHFCLGWQASKPQWWSWLRHTTELGLWTPGFLHGSEDLNWVPRACTASSPTDPSPQAGKELFCGRLCGVIKTNYPVDLKGRRFWGPRQDQSTKEG